MKDAHGQNSRRCRFKLERHAGADRGGDSSGFHLEETKIVVVSRVCEEQDQESKREQWLEKSLVMSLARYTGNPFFLIDCAAEVCNLGNRFCAERYQIDILLYRERSVTCWISCEDID